MGFDLFAAVMAILSVLSFGAVGGADIVDDPADILSGITDTKPQTNTPSVSVPETPGQETKAGAELVAGTWRGKASVPLVISVSFFADVEADGTAQFSGTVSSSLFGNHVFDTPADWQYLGGDKFDVLISGTHTPVTCNGKTLTFPLNPYKLGLTDTKAADKEFIINLERES